MVWGILEDKHMDHVPGTVLLADASDIPVEYRTTRRELLKYGRGRFADVVLVPQPSNSPNDPLNWPTWRKDTILIIVSLSSAVVGASKPMLSPGFVKIAAELNITVITLSRLAAWMLFAIGIAAFVFNPFVRKIGRRPVFVISIIILVTGSFWGAVSQNYESFAGSRIYSALGLAPYEILVQCTIADMYFVHERATRIAVWNMFLLCGFTGAPLPAGYIIENQGWKWTLQWCGIFSALVLPLIILFVPETAYRRHPRNERLAAGVTRDSRGPSESPDHSIDKDKKNLSTASETGVTIELKDPFWRSLRLYTGVYTKTPLWKIFLRPLVILWYPAVLWAFLLYGSTFAILVAFSVIKAVIFTAPPYKFSISQVGLICVSPFLLTFIGEIIAGPLNDRFCLWLARKNRGIYEPEFRLPPIIISCLIGVAGIYGYGATIHYETHWSGPVLCFGLANMSLGFSNASVFGYVIDAHKDLSQEAFVAINARNFLSFALVYCINGWLDRDGVLAVFSTLGSAFVVVNMLTIPLWIFGKRIRGHIARNEALRRFMNED